MKLNCKIIIIMILSLIITCSVLATSKSISIEGIVIDDKTSQPVSYATVLVLGSGKSTLTNKNGEYRLLLIPGNYDIKFSHVAYYSEKVKVTVRDNNQKININLKSNVIELPGIDVYTKAYDPGQQIILKAIKHKKDILAKIKNYTFDAYTKFVLDEVIDKDSSEIFFIGETQVSSFWEQPDNYKEIISSRRQTKNFSPENVLITVGELLNFNKNRIEFGQYAIVSPTANDALDHYNYYLLDTIVVDNRNVFRLEIEPKSTVDPLFFGFIHIADSTYDVVAVDVGFTDAVEYPFIDNLKYRQDFAQLENEFWMPIKITYSADIKFDIPIPKIPKEMTFQHIASLYNYSFDTGFSDGFFDEYEIVVNEDADDFDSTIWASRQAIPLTTEELEGYNRIDSIAALPKPILRQVALGLVGASMFAMLGGDYNIFHFNRVEGAYLGLKIDLDNNIPNTKLTLGSGYSFELKDWQHRYGIQYQFSDKNKLYLGFEYKKQISHRPTIFASENSNQTFTALFFKIDPFDYFKEDGFKISAGIKPINHTRLKISYFDYKQSSMPLMTDYSFFEKDKIIRGNPAISDGHLRSVAVDFTYDSRKLFKLKKRETKSYTNQYTKIKIGFEHASPDFIDNDFNYNRYYISLFRRNRFFGLGFLSLYLYGGDSNGELPAQKYFTIDFQDEIFVGSHGFRTLSENNFAGSRAFAVSANHNFGHILFYKSGLPLIKNIPFTLSVHGSALWSEIENRSSVPNNNFIFTAPKAYTELGFGLANLTPFINPFNFSVSFTWQLSDYNTSHFSWQFGIKL